MILTRSSGLVTLSLLLLAAMPAASASAKKAKPRPTVSSVAPLTAGIGDQLTIKGKNFVLGSKKNTVFFKAGNRPAVSVKSVSSTRKVIKVIIPKSVEKYMTVKGGVLQATRFKLRILSKRFGKKYSALKLSPMIAPGSVTAAPPKAGPGSGSGPGSGPGTIAPPPDCDRDGVVDSVDTDDDNDLLSDTLETSLTMGTCDRDSDGDGMEDGWEYQSALDLNNTEEPLPYPGKRPYPNPLDGSDGFTDFDGDGLRADQESLMWTTFGPHSLVLSYSAGLKRSVPGPDDDFRDVDADGLSNFDEFNGRMLPEWWAAAFDTEKVYNQPYQATDPVDRDTDGDTKLDGDDDIDHDGWTNVDELSRSAFRVNPFNPCLPDYNSATCSHHWPFGAAWAPFDGSAGDPLPPSPIAMP